MKKKPVAAIALALLVALFGPATVSMARGETPPLYPWEGKRITAVPTPAQVLGYELGERLVDHADTQRYLDALAAKSDRVRIFSYARSHEGRALRYAVISSPANLSRLQEWRTGMARLADPRSLPESDASDLVKKTPAFVWLAYSVHGNEHSSTEAAISVAYHLASADDVRTLAILDNVVVFIDPIQNPDGRDRFIRSYREALGPIPMTDPVAAEHDEPWPSGRFNHDLFDMNRDWFSQTQPEVRGKVSAVLAWHPLIFVDLHEMGSDQTYYFPPPAKPLNPNVADSASKWFRLVGEANSRVFDAMGFDYFTREVFDLFYPGYGDSWPTLSDSIGMTYEEAGARGLAIERKDGSILTLRDAMRRHIASSLTTVEFASAHREELLRDYAGARRTALESAGPVQAYVIPGAPDAAGAARLANLLIAQGILVDVANEPFSVRATRGDDDPVETHRFLAGSLIVPLAQPARRLLTALFERDTPIDESVLRDAAERRRLHGTPPFYDATAWSLPLALNLPAFKAVEAPHPSRTALAPTAATGLPGHGEPPDGFDFWPPPIPQTMPLTNGAAAPPLAETNYAYLLPPSGNGALAALASLVGRPELVVEVSAKAFTIDGRSWAPGTAVLKVRRNPETLRSIVDETARKFGVEFGAAASGRVESGVDLGSASFVRVKMPRIATIYGEPASATSTGWLRYVLEERYGITATPVRARALATDADLRRYDVIVLPDGSATGYRDALGKDGIARLTGWIESGGTMITIKGAAAFAASKETGWASSRLMKRPRSAPLVPLSAASGTTADRSATPAPAGSADADPNGGEGDPGAEENPDFVPGAIVRVLLEPSHPLAFGYDAEVPVIVSSNLVFSLSKNGMNAGVFATKERLRLGGFMWKESIDLLAGKPYVISESRGRGNVILFADDPNFRGGWDGLNRMFLNAILLVSPFGS